MHAFANSWCERLIESSSSCNATTPYPAIEMATLDPQLVSESQPGNATTDELHFEQALSFALCKLENKDFTLKAQQKEAVKHVWEGKDVFVLLPTGFGKSIIYEVLPFLFDYKLRRMHGQTKSLVIVMSPLVSLMADQVSSLRRRGVEAAIMSSKCATVKDFLATETSTLAVFSLDLQRH